MPEFENYQAFETTESAEAVLGTLLLELNIPYRISKVRSDADVMFAKSSMPMNIWLQIYPADFDRVTKLLETGAYETVKLDKHHFLNSYSETELREVIYKADEWNATDHAMARKILESRGIRYTPAELEEIRASRLQELRRPRSGMGLVISGFAVLVLGGILSVILGWGLYTATRTDPIGRKFYEYDERSRKAGYLLVVLGIAVFIYYVIRLVMSK